jgi:hypothetical protein
MLVDGSTQCRELLHNLPLCGPVSGECVLGDQNENTPHESDNIHGGRIVRITEEVHQREYHTCGNLGEFDSHDMDGLNQKLAILRILSRKYLSYNP